MLAAGVKQTAVAPAQVAGAEQEALQQPAAPVRDADETDHVYGPANAPITLIEYSDFECPYCKRHFETVNQIKAEYKDKVRIVFRHFPLDFHPNAQKAAEASECAADIGGNDAFWKMHDKIFTAQDITVTGLKRLAKEIGLNEGKFNECLDSGKMATKVLAQADEAATFGVQGTPANFINGQEVPGGARPFSDFKSAIDSMLAQ
jgi:protein-disulfide isomerase